MSQQTIRTEHAIRWIDTHAHVHDDKMAKPPADSLQDARNNGVEAFVVIGTDAETSQAAINVASNNSDVCCVMWM